MKKWIVLFIAIVLTGLIFWSCSDDSSTEPGNDTTSPTVSLTYPANNAEFNEGASVTLKANASDNEAVSKVEFYVDSDLVGTGETSPYQVSWNTTGKVGSHTIYAKAYDPSNNSGSSIVTTVKINQANIAPVINSLTANPTSVVQSGTSTITCLASDANGDSLTYTWQASGGTLSGTGSTRTWTAPSTVGTYTITCTVSDGSLTDDETVNVSVTTANIAPVINSLTANPTSVVQSGTSTITCLASDANGDSLTYTWQASGGTLSGTGSTRTWTAPSTVGTYTIACTVSDGSLTDVETVNVSVTTANIAPVINSLTANPTSVVQSGTSTITCTASDANGDALTYTWQASGGTLSGTGSTRTWTAPTTVGTYTITCTVSDGLATDSESKSITVTEYTPPSGMVYVQGGTFQMGDSFSEGNTWELPVHSVTLSSFYMGKYEVTQAEWSAYMPAENWSSYGTGNTYPAYYVSWYKIIKYCNLKSMAEGLTPCYTISGSTDPAVWGAVPTSNNTTWNAVVCNWSAKGYRLPTEAEWEYAARGGIHNADNLRYSGCHVEADLTNYAWYYGNYTTDTSQPVGTKLPNQLGLYDMSGNEWEWCWDWWVDTYTTEAQVNPTGPLTPTEFAGRDSRGGYWGIYSEYSRVAARDYRYPYNGSSTVGFRLSRRP